MAKPPTALISRRFEGDFFKPQMLERKTDGIFSILLKENEKNIELRFLPSYSPDLNPDEYLNRDMKSRLGSLPMTDKSEVLHERVEGYMIVSKMILA